MINLSRSHLWNVCCAAFIGIAYLQNAQAQPAFCELAIYANDSRAMISINNVELGSAPLKVACKNQPQTIRIKASDDQVFTRVLAAAKDIPETNPQWHIEFQASNSHSAHADVESKNLQVKGGLNDDQIMAELLRIRRILEVMATTRPDLQRQVASVSDQPQFPVQLGGRLDPNVAATGSGKQTFKKGIYVQLYSLTSEVFKVEEIKSEVEKIGSKISGAFVKFCSAHTKPNNQKWTRVLLGPMPEEKMAKDIVGAIGRDSFVVHKNSCSQAATDLKFEPKE